MEAERVVPAVREEMAGEVPAQESVALGEMEAEVDLVGRV